MISEALTIQIIILSRDRPDYLKETIQSVLNQKISREKIEIIISDNSDKNDVKGMISQNYPNSNLKYMNLTQILYSKSVLFDRRHHTQYARVTMDDNGKVLKLAVSR